MPACSGVQVHIQQQPAIALCFGSLNISPSHFQSPRTCTRGAAAPTLFPASPSLGITRRPIRAIMFLCRAAASYTVMQALLQHLQNFIERVLADLASMGPALKASCSAEESRAGQVGGRPASAMAPMAVKKLAMPPCFG